MEVVDGAVAVADFIGGTGGDGGGDIFLGEAGGIVEVGTFCEIGCYCRAKVQNTVNEYLSEKQLKQYITALQHEENIYAKAFLMTALYTGMRKKAIYYLAWQDSCCISVRIFCSSSR